MNIINVKATSYNDQKFGTSGLRKKVAVFQQQNYLENFLYAIFTTIGVSGKTFVLGGDGRYFNKEAISVALKMLVNLGAKKVYIGQNYLFSTPAISHFIRKNKLDYGVIFSASHNPAGKNGDFGIKVNGKNGSGITEQLGDQIYEATKNIKEYQTLDNLNVNFTNINQQKILNTEVEIVSPIIDYSLYMEQIFDFNKIKALLQTSFTMCYEAFNTVTGIYAEDIFVNKLGVSKNCLYNVTPLEDFGGHHADPNKIYAKHLVDLSNTENSPNILFASDGDGDRNMIIGKNIIVSPSDSLAILLKYAELIPFYKGKVCGVARSMPTSRAVDLVAQKLQVSSFAVPTGWKFFGNLLEQNKITFCGEESCGTGSIHSGEKDGIWAMLFWLNILAEIQKPVKDIVTELWQEYGRFYYIRLDYENISREFGKQILSNIASLNGLLYNNLLITSSKFNYQDPVTGEIVNNKADILQIGDNIRVIVRESGTGTGDTTVRIYMEQLESSNIYVNNQDYLQPLINFIVQNVCNGILPTLID